MTPTVIFAWRRVPPPFLIGGAEVSQQLLAEEFAAAGWHTLYLASHEPPWSSRSELPAMHQHLHKADSPHVYEPEHQRLRYTWNGVHVQALPQYRLAADLDRAVNRFHPRLVITSQEGSAALTAAVRDRTTVAGWLHSVSPTGMHILDGHPHYALAVSRFVLERIPGHHATVLLYPPFKAPALPADTGPRDEDLLLINPVPQKGATLLHQLIELLPERRFTLVEGWWNTAADFARHSNVRYLPRTYTMERLYARHRLLLVPSLVEDAYPRVIHEAGLHHLPALGSPRGGIPEAIADPSMLAPTEDPYAWAARIRSLSSSDLTHLGRQAHQRSSELTRPRLPELEAAGVLSHSRALLAPRP